MDTRYKFSDNGDRPIVYVRPVKVAELPKEVRDQAIGDGEIYALHSADGERLALVKDRKLAFLLADQNDMDAVSVH